MSLPSQDPLPLQDKKEEEGTGRVQDPDQGPAQVPPLGDASPDPLFPDTISPVRAERQHNVLQDVQHVLSQRAERHIDPMIPMRSMSQRAER